jgi:hypothetical protein
MTNIKTYRDHLLEHPMMGPEAALMQEVKELRSALTEAQRDSERYRWLRDSLDSPIISEAQATDKMVDKAIAAMKGAA